MFFRRNTTACLKSMSVSLKTRINLTGCLQFLIFVDGFLDAHDDTDGGASFVYNERTGDIIFTDMETKGVFGLDPVRGETIPIVQAGNKDIYYADFAVHPEYPHLTVAIQERHDVLKVADVKNSLVLIDSLTMEVRPLATGADFYTYPRWSSDGTKLCWVSFRFPNMPWDSTELWLGDFEDGTVKNARCVAGEETKASITQPRWSPDGQLYFISDVTNYWQIYAYDGRDIRHFKLSGLESCEVGGLADWFLGGSSYVFLTEKTMVACFNHENRWTVIKCNYKTKEWEDLLCSIVEITIDSIKAVSDTSFAIIGATTSLPMLVTVVDINQGGLGTVLRKSSRVSISEEYVSVPNSITFPRIHGPGGGEAHGLLYFPNNPQFQALPTPSHLSSWQFM